MIPVNFEEWYNCITKDCKIQLTKEFAAQRLTIYENKENSETQKFIELYGEGHLANIISWLERV